MLRPREEEVIWRNLDGTLNWLWRASRSRSQLKFILGTWTSHFWESIPTRRYWFWQAPFWNPPSSSLVQDLALPPCQLAQVLGSPWKRTYPRPTVNQLLSDLLSWSPRHMTPPNRGTVVATGPSLIQQVRGTSLESQAWSCLPELTPALEQQGPAGRDFRINFTHHWTGRNASGHTGPWYHWPVCWLLNSRAARPPTRDSRTLLHLPREKTYSCLSQVSLHQPWDSCIASPGSPTSILVITKGHPGPLPYPTAG